MATWPTTLPAPCSDSYQLSPVDPTIRTDMEAGTSRARRRTTARNDKVSVSWDMSDAQLAIFRTWFEDASTGAAGGANWFTVSLPIGTTGLVPVDARFSRVYTAAYVGYMYWKVSAELELR